MNTELGKRAFYRKNKYTKMRKKISLGFSPTPLYELQNFSKLFEDYKVFIKRDDNNGVAIGGNKIRKLEYLLQDAIEQGCDTIITAGAQQSNHCRLTIASCAQKGLKCHLMLGGEEPTEYNGNLLLSYLLGAKIHFAGENRKGEDIPALVEELKKQGAKPYVVPYGGSNAIGALGYADAMSEIKQQLEEQNLSIDYVVFASSSGGTHSGILAGIKMFKLDCEAVGISIDKDETNGHTLEEIIEILMPQIYEIYGYQSLGEEPELILNRDYDKAGYGVVTPNEKQAIKMLAASEGVLLDPVYTGRAFGGLIDLMRKKYFKPGANILFIHTGGTPATFCYSGDLVVGAE